MIVLDTNVVSEMMEAQPAAEVAAWLNEVDKDSLWLNAVLVFEIKGGFDAMDDGRRKKRFLAALDALVEVVFRERVLPLDLAAASAAARIDAERKRVGRPVEVKDTLMAGIAVSRGAAIATRNVRHFADLPVPVIKPWATSS
jgi:predicted nucleic acid-binding protein